MLSRKPRYLESEHGGRERWLISYTDIVTILLILFVAVAANEMKAHVDAARPVPIPVPLEVEKPRPHESLVRAEQELKKHALDLRLEPRGLVISLPQAILFASGDDQVKPEARAVISQIAAVIQDIPNRVALVGHADSVPIHNRRFKNNWELSTARSLSLLELLTTEYGIAEARLSVQGDGSYSPKNSGETADARAENRRVEILILDEPAPR